MCAPNICSYCSTTYNFEILFLNITYFKLKYRAKIKGNSNYNHDYNKLANESSQISYLCI